MGEEGGGQVSERAGQEVAERMEVIKTRRWRRRGEKWEELTAASRPQGSCY